MKLEEQISKESMHTEHMCADNVNWEKKYFSEDVWGSKKVSKYQ